MVTTPAQRHAQQHPTRSDLPRRWWGLTLRELHDRLWAARGVQVIRPASSVEPRGPSLYLLLAGDQFVLFDLNRVRRALGWLSPRVMRVRVSDHVQDRYAERIESDGGRFRRVLRDYRPRCRGIVRCMLTPDPAIARAWAAAPDARSGRRTVRALAGPDSTFPAQVPGRSFNPSDASFDAELIKALMERSQRLGLVVDGVFEYLPGVWMHESVRPPAGARFVAPVWIGAGIDLEPRQAVLGPRAIPDADAEPAPSTPIAWHDLALPNWPIILPTLKGRRLRRITKRLFDIAFAATVLLFTLPLYPFIILAIALEDGWPPFFAHGRQTLGGREFPCLKFRTMMKNAEHLKDQLAAKNQADGPQFFIKDDPRLLKSGRWLRRFQLDELPQFINVLLGHMSVVGPRPSPDKENQYCPAWREARLSVRPGVTGLWQIRRTRAPETDFQEWIRYDLEYVQHESWTMDLWIIFQTVKRIFTG